MEVTPEQGQEWGVSTPYASTEELVAAAERAQVEARRATERVQDIAAAMIEDGTIPVARLARLFGVTRPTLYTWKKAADARKSGAVIENQFTPPAKKPISWEEHVAEEERRDELFKALQKNDDIDVIAARRGVDPKEVSNELLTRVGAGETDIDLNKPAPARKRQRRRKS